MRRTPTPVLIALGLSGVAGLANQATWQRALKVFLGGSETLAAMIVVVVFLMGLALGAGLAARAARALRNPLRALAAVEGGLAIINIIIASVLGMNITESVATVQRLAVSTGVSLYVVYAAAAAIILLPSTLLMGATIPLSSEALQRQCDARSTRLIQFLVVANTVGGALGAYAASAWLLPVTGQRATLLVAAGLNAGAAVVVGLASWGRATALQAALERGRVRNRRLELLAAVLGFLALGYEVSLFRMLALTHEPLPTTFATGLAGFLLAWSVGVSLAAARRAPLGYVAALGTAAIGLTYWSFDIQFWNEAWGLPLALAAYLGPCVAFGVCYGLLLARAAGDWGRDVGRLTAASTIGSCTGVVVFTMAGNDMPIGFTLGAIGIALLGVAAWEMNARRLVLVAALGVLVVGTVGLRTPYTEHDGTRTYWGRDGVVEIRPDRSVYIDGLWHTKLSDGTSHVGQHYNWLMSLAAALAHRGPASRGLVVGEGVGISGVVLTGVGGIQVDGYEINHTLQRVLEDYPEETLGAQHAPRLTWIWGDARVGLALHPTQYDIILSAPLHLRQAGSSLLLSREYLRLLKSRLAPGGVVVVYSSERSEAQAQIVQATVAELFPYRATWYGGLLTVASDRPVAVSAEEFQAALLRPERLFQEAKAFDASLAQDGGLWSWYDGDAAPVAPGIPVVTDDWPLVEYPTLVEARIH